MKCRDEENVIICLNKVVLVTKQFPVGVIDEHENAWPYCVAGCKEFRSFLEVIISQICN